CNNIIALVEVVPVLVGRVREQVVNVLEIIAVGKTIDELVLEYRQAVARVLVGIQTERDNLVTVLIVSVVTTGAGNAEFRWIEMLDGDFGSVVIKIDIVSRPD